MHLLKNSNNFTVGKNLLPAWRPVMAERNECISKDFKCNDTEAIASVKGTCDNWLDRWLQDEDIMPMIDRLYEKHGNALDLGAIINAGYDGSNINKYKVDYIIYIYIYIFI